MSNQSVLELVRQTDVRRASANATEAAYRGRNVDASAAAYPSRNRVPFLVPIEVILEEAFEQDVHYRRVRRAS